MNEILCFITMTDRSNGINLRSVNSRYGGVQHGRYAPNHMLIQGYL